MIFASTCWRVFDAQKTSTVVRVKHATSLAASMVFPLLFSSFHDIVHSSSRSRTRRRSCLELLCKVWWSYHGISKSTGYCSPSHVTEAVTPMNKWKSERQHDMPYKMEWILSRLQGIAIQEGHVIFRYKCAYYGSYVEIELLDAKRLWQEKLVNIWMNGIEGWHGRIEAIHRIMQSDWRRTTSKTMPRTRCSTMIQSVMEDMIVRYETPPSECCQSSSSARLKFRLILRLKWYLVEISNMPSN